MEGKQQEVKRNVYNIACDWPGNIPTEDDFLKDMVQLSQDINVSDVASEKGTVFEVTREQGDMQEMLAEAEDFFCDESLFSSLTLGAGNGLFDDGDESSNSDDNSEPFEKLARQMEDVSGDGGVLKLEVGPGIGGDIPSEAVVIFHYSAFLEYSDEPFDSTHLRNKPERKRLDGSGLLPGVNIALKTMRKNETSRFLIKPHYAFGKMGCPPRIPGDETLFYEIHIINFVDVRAADAYEDQNQQSATFQEKLDGARGYHRKGNDLYREGNLTAAKTSYLRAAWIMEDAKLQNQEEEKQRGSVLVKVRSNLAQVISASDCLYPPSLDQDVFKSSSDGLEVFLDLKEPAHACTQCKLGLSVTGVQSDDIISKIYYRFGKAKTVLCDFKGALKELRRAQKLRPHNADVSAALESLLIKKEKYEEQEKFMFKRMFSTYVNGTEATQGLEQTAERGNQKRDVNHNVLGVRPEFERIVEDQILDFAADPNVKELPFPSNLSQAEIACIAAAAKAADLHVTLTQRGLESHLKISKKN